MGFYPQSNRVLWRQVIALAVVQGTISLLWVIYNLYLAQLLIQVGLSAGLATTLLVIENLIAAVIEPLMGTFSDRVQRWFGTKFPVIAGGMLLAAICSIAIPVGLIYGGGTSLKIILPLLLIGWSTAMALFRSPALSLLGRYAIGSRLSRAAAVLTLVGGVAGAMGPLAGQFILSLGPLAAFGAGSVALLAAAAVLNWVNPAASVPSKGDYNYLGGGRSRQEQLFDLVPVLALVSLTGMAVTLGFRLLMDNLPKLLEQQVAIGQPKLLMGGIFIALAITALPAGQLAQRLGNRLTMIYGTLLMGLFCGIAPWTYHSGVAVLVALCLGASLSLVSNGTLPFVLSMVPPSRAGLGTGIYFSGGAIAASLFGSFLAGSVLTAPLGLRLGAIAFLAAAALVSLSRRLRPTTP